MRTSIVIGLLLCAANAAAAQKVTCLVAVDSIGVRAGRLTEMRAHLRAEGRAVGARLTFFEKGAAPERACFDDSACLRRAIGRLDVDAVLYLQLVRVGGTVQLSARSYRADSADQIEQTTMEASTSGFPRSVALRDLLTTVLGELLIADEPEPAPKPEPKPEPASAVDLTAPNPETLSALAPGVTTPPPPVAEFPWTPVIVAASGGALILAGTAMTASQNGVLNDPRTTGGSKERAHTIGRVGWGGISIGAATAVTGLVMLGLELLED